MTDFEPWITEPGRYQLDEDVYHADPVVGGSLSSSGARTLVNSTPARFAHDREHGRPDTPALVFGRVVHTIVLGAGAPIAEVDAPDWRSKAAKETAATLRADGITPVLTADLRRAEAMAAAVHAHPIAGPLLARPGESEASFVGRCPDTGVMCRIRVDRLPDTQPGARALAIDVKTTGDASPHGFALSMAKYGYHQQGGFYGDVLRWLDVADDVQTVFVAVEKDPPHLVLVATPSAEAIAWAAVLNRKARDLYALHSDIGMWPGYPDHEPVELHLPGWQEREYETADAAGAYRTTADLIGDRP